MATKTSKANKSLNKSEAIRNLKKDNPSMKTRKIAELMLSTHGVEVSPLYVSSILSQAKRKGNKVGTRGRPRKEAKPSNRKPSNGMAIDVQSLLKAKKLVKEFGSVAQAREAIDALAKLIR